MWDKMMNMPAIGLAALLLAGCVSKGVLTEEKVMDQGSVSLGYTIVYVDDVEATLSFFEQAFGLQRGFVNVEGEMGYGELNTGSTVLSFATHGIAKMSLPEGYVSASESEKPLGMEIGLVTQDVEATHLRAIECGAVELSAPYQKPWGQTVSYVRSPGGILIELCTPVAPVPSGE